jgi:hypothetical protein
MNRCHFGSHLQQNNQTKHDPQVTEFRSSLAIDALKNAANLNVTTNHQLCLIAAKITIEVNAVGGSFKNLGRLSVGSYQLQIANMSHQLGRIAS